MKETGVMVDVKKTENITINKYEGDIDSGLDIDITGNKADNIIVEDKSEE